MRFNLWRALTAIIIIILLGATWYLYKLYHTSTITNARLTEQKKTLETEFDNLSKQKQSLEANLTEIKKERESLIGKINEYDTKIQEMTAANEAKVQQMTSEIDKLRESLSQAEKELPKKEDEISYLKKLIKNNQVKITELNEKLGKTKAAEAKTSVSLQPITVTPEAPKISAKVIEVNAEYGFIVIDAGSKRGIKAGDTLFVSRNGKELLGKVVVEKVRDSICVAKILYKSLGDAAKKGDTVTN